MKLAISDNGSIGHAQRLRFKERILRTGAPSWLEHFRIVTINAIMH